MTGKIFLSSNELTKDSFRLAKKIYDSGWHPEVISKKGQTLLYKLYYIC